MSLTAENSSIPVVRATWLLFSVQYFLLLLGLQINSVPFWSDLKAKKDSELICRPNTIEETFGFFAMFKKLLSHRYRR